MILNVTYYDLPNASIIVVSKQLQNFKNSMIFETSKDNHIITFLQARKLAEQELADTIQQKTAQLTLDEIALKQYELEIAKGTVSTERFSVIMKDASIEAQNYATSTRGSTGSTQTSIRMFR